MRFVCLLLITSLFAGSSAKAVEFFGDFLNWKATEPVDWVLNTNASPSNQFVDYETFSYESSPGFRVGVGHEEEWGTKVYYTHHHSSTIASASGDLTGAFLGAKLAQPPAPDYYFDTGQAESSIDYNVIDWDITTEFFLTRRFSVRPVVGIRGAWINQSFSTAFQAAYPRATPTQYKDLTENIQNDFWGLGPKLGIENTYRLMRGRMIEVSGVANFYAAYLWGEWNISDVSHATLDDNGTFTQSTQRVETQGRDFGSLSFQTLVGFSARYYRLSTTVGYEINDWLNQCQIFDDATGPHNNDLLLQGLTLRAELSY